jgi:hypothetical protein
MEALMLVARGGPTMLARIGVMRAFHRNDAGESQTLKFEIYLQFIWSSR